MASCQEWCVEGKRYLGIPRFQEWVLGPAFRRISHTTFKMSAEE